MNSKLKIILAFTATLIIGVVMGALLSGAVAHYQTDRAEKMRTADGMTEALIETVEPTDAQQEEALRETMRRHSSELQEIRRSCRDDIRASVDSMHSEIANLLTEQQRERLQKRIGDRRDEHRGERRQRSRPH